MKFSPLWLVVLVACLNIGWISESGSGVVSEENVVSATSIEATQVLLSDTLSKLQGETQLGGATNYVSISSAGVVSFNNVAVSTVIGLKNDDKLSWLGSAYGTSFEIGVSTDNAFIVPTSMDVNGILSADSISVPTARFTDVSVDSLGVTGTIIASGNTTLVGASIDNVTANGATITNGTVTTLGSTTATVTTLNATTASITSAYISGTASTVSADNVTTGGITVTANIDAVSIDVAAIEADDYRTSAGTSGITSDYTVDTAGVQSCIVSVESGIITKWTC